MQNSTQNSIQRALAIVVASAGALLLATTSVQAHHAFSAEFDAAIQDTDVLWVSVTVWEGSLGSKLTTWSLVCLASVSAKRLSGSPATSA